MSEELMDALLDYLVESGELEKACVSISKEESTRAGAARCLQQALAELVAGSPELLDAIDVELMDNAIAMRDAR